MKKVSFMIAALALVLGTSQCRKEDKPMLNGEKQHVVLNASFGSSNSKIAQNGAGLKWTAGDKLTVGGVGSGKLSCIGPENGTFEGDITASEGNITFTFGAQKFTEQTGELNDAIYLTAETAYQVDGNYDVTMEMPQAVLKLDLSAFAGSGNVSISDGTNTATVTGVTAESKAVYVAMPADGTEKTYIFRGNGKGVKKTWLLEANTFYTRQGATGPTGESLLIEPPMLYVDLGLESGTLWATCNVGAVFPEEIGDYFAWGETEPYYSNLNPLTWKDGKSGGYCWQSYCGKGSYSEWDPVPYNASTNVLESDYDAAFANWGDDWRMPTKGEWKELYDDCKWEWLDDYNGKSGYKVLNKADDSKFIFLPITGYLDGTSLNDASSIGYYWSSSFYTVNPRSAHGMNFGKDVVSPQFTYSRFDGFIVRPVR
ncbi:MAG: hypothetical protein KBT57_00940 [bacterium]|nr:hypothetical protein [Candidatus Limimorpha equi]